MKSSIGSVILGAAFCFASASFAQAPADAPAGTNGICKDGSYSQNAVKKGACRGHKGVQEWYAAAPAGAAAAAPAASAAAPAPAAAAAPATAAPPPMAPAAPKKAASGSGPAYTPPANPAPGGGAGLVWVNSSSNVYHCPGTEWYGKTKHGEYMSEADAKAKNARPDHGKTCQ
jgi:Protein of unknown function (DUF3761)